MVDDDAIRQFSRLLASAGRAHHEAVGAPSDTWAEWYAEFLLPDIGDHVGFQPTLEQVTGWLTEADRHHRAEAPDERWPGFYARWILESLDG